MPIIDTSDLNIVVAVLGAFTILYGLIAIKIKQVWYLGEALPAVLAGIILGPISAQFIDTERWGHSVQDQTGTITLGLARVVICVQLVIAGYQLPAKYPWHRWKDLALLLLPVMTAMWLCTTGCMLLMIPGLTTLSAMALGSMVTPTDPVLSQAIAKGPFADKYVPRALREIISAEAGANDGFGFPFLMLATYLIRHAPEDGVNFKSDASDTSHGTTDVGRLGGGTGRAMEQWIVETWIYFIGVAVVVGAVLGIARDGSTLSVCFSTPPHSAFLIMGVCGLAGLDDLLACFCAGAAMNWNGAFLAETLARHDEVNSSIDVLLNFGGFMYIGAILPWSEMNSDVTGITPGRLIALGVLVLLLRRIPAIMVMYKAMPNVVKNWKEALFMGYFGPIGIGAVFYVEHAHHLFPHLEDIETPEEENLLRAMRPVVYFLVLFSIVVHGLSIPALELIYRWQGVQPVMELEPSLSRRRSMSEALPPNSHVDPMCGSVVRHNRFSRAISRDGTDDEEAWRTRSRNVSFSGRPGSRGVSWVSRPGSRTTSRGRQPDAPPVWRLGDDTDVEDTPRKDDEEKDGGPRIQFMDEMEMRPRKSTNDARSPTLSFNDGPNRAKSTSAISFSQGRK